MLGCFLSDIVEYFKEKGRLERGNVAEDGRAVDEEKLLLLQTF